jgi:hypothetical protein
VDEGPVRRKFTLDTGGAREVERDLLLGGHALTVLTEDAEGKPMRAEVHLNAVEGDPDLQSAVFQSEGRLAVPHLREARYTVQANFAGGASVVAEAAVPAAREVVLREPPTGRVELEVAGDREGDALLVFAGAFRPGLPPEDPAAGLGWQQAPVSESGQAVLPRLPAGTLQIRLGRRGGWGEVPFRLGDAPPATMHTATLEAGKTLRLRLSVEPAR